MTIQVFIEGQDHADIVRQVQGLAGAFGVLHQTEVVTNVAPAPVGDDIETPQPPATTEQAPATPSVPNPTKKTVALAEELGVDLAEVTGTGKDGRVTQVDVKEYAKARTSETSEGPSTEPEPPDEAPATVPAVDPFADESAAIEPTKDNATAALRVVHGQQGMDACMTVLKALGANRISDVAAEKYGEFIDKCAETLDIDTAGLQQKMNELAA